ncbi:MAG TPA: zinc-binding alcohol dehydrogenase family protein [Candidatus Dormibacteraeota bacterium]
MEAMELVAPAPPGLGPLRLSDRPQPVPGAGDVRLRVEACAVCRTDLQIARGDLPAKRSPIVPGHQVVGRVVEAGAGVPAALLGRRLGVGWLASACGSCTCCRSGRENLCRAAAFTGWDRDGGFATEVVVRLDFAQPLDGDLDPVLLAPLLCGGVIGFRALRLAAVGNGDRLGLFGFGASARLVLQVALAEGCEVSVVTRDQAARGRARALGASWVGWTGELPAGSLQGAITFAPAGQVVVDALRSLDRGGTCVVNAIHLDGIPAFAYELLYWERRLISVANFTRQDARDFLVAARRSPVRTTVTEFPLRAANAALLGLERGELSGAAVLVPDLSPAEPRTRTATW